MQSERESVLLRVPWAAGIARLRPFVVTEKSRCPILPYMAGARSITRAESDCLLRALRCDRDRLLVLAGQHLGLRISELLSLTVGMVANGLTPKSEISIPRRNLKAGRSRRKGHGRTLPVHLDLRSSIALYLSNFPGGGVPSPEAYLFPSREGGPNSPLGARQAWYIIKKTAVAAGLDATRISTHSLRKTYASELYEHSGHDLRACQICLGHSDIGSTIKYIEPDRDRLNALILSLPSRVAPAMAAHISGPVPCIRSAPATLHNLG